MILTAPSGSLDPFEFEELAALHAAAFLDLASPYSAGEMRRLCEAGARVIAARADHGLPEALSPFTGFAMHRTAADEAELIVIAVAPVDRRHGIGRALLAAAEADAAVQGAERMILEVAVGNDPARGLYGAAGYEQIGRRRAYYARPDGTQEDAILLARRLTAASAAD